MTTYAPIDALPAEVLDAYQAQSEELEEAHRLSIEAIFAERFQRQRELEEGPGAALNAAREVYAAEEERAYQLWSTACTQAYDQYNRQCAELLVRLLGEYIARQVA